MHLIETGKVRPSARSLQIIARRLGVSAQSFQLTTPGDPRAEEGVAELERLCEWQRYSEVVDLAPELLARDLSIQEQGVTRLTMGRALMHLGRLDQALYQLRRSRRAFEAENDAWSAAEARDWEAATLYLKEDPRAVTTAEDALRRYRLVETRRPEVEARMLEHLATFLLRESDFVQAHERYDEALRVAGPVLNMLRLGHIYLGLSRCQLSLGDLKRAIELASRAVALYAVENDLRPVPARTDLPRAENDLGMLLIRNGQLDRAEELFQAALQHLEESGAERLRSYFLLSVAELRQAQHRSAEALELVGEAIDVAVRLDEQIAVATAYEQLGQLHAERAEDALADGAFDRALAVFADLGMTERAAECSAAYQLVLEARGDTARLERFAG